MAIVRSILGNVRPQDSESFDPQEFIRKYEEQYLETGNRSGWKKKKTFAPSKLGYKYSEGVCPRYWYIAFNGAEFTEDIDSRSLSNMENGTFAHERIQANIAKMGILREKELEVLSQDPPIRGFVDVMIDWANKLIPGEIKTANADNFTFRVASGKPTGSHYVQFIIYLKLTDSDEGFLLYENKDTQELAIIRVFMDEKAQSDIDYLFDWMRNTYKAFEEDKLPTNPFPRKNAKICKTCPVRSDCFNPNKWGIGDITLPILDVPVP